MDSAELHERFKLEDVPTEDLRTILTFSFGRLRLAEGRIEYLRGHVTVRRGNVMDGRALLVTAAEDVARHDPALAVLMLAEAAHACFYAANVPGMLEAAERAYGLVPATGDTRTEYVAAVALGVAKVMAGEPAMEHFRRAVELVDASGELPRDPRLLVWATLAPLFLREAEAGRAMIERALDLAREQSAVGVLPYLLGQVARDDAMTNRRADSQRFLVTGALGCIGAWTLRHLVRSGVDVIAADLGGQHPLGSTDAIERRAARG